MAIKTNIIYQEIPITDAYLKVSRAEVVGSNVLATIGVYKDETARANGAQVTSIDVMLSMGDILPSIYTAIKEQVYSDAVDC